MSENHAKVAPAVGAIDQACQEILDSRDGPAARALVKKIAIQRKKNLDTMCNRAGQMESAYVLVSELERYRKINIYGIDTEASLVAYVIYTLNKNYSSVFEQIKETLNQARASQLEKKFRKLPLL